MTRLRRLGPAIVAVACLLAAAVLLVLALDARAWQRTITRDDLRFRALPGHTGLWRSPSLLPGDPAKQLLGLSDGLAYRHALQLVWHSRAGAHPPSKTDLTAIRIDAETSLESLVDRGATAGERSTAANLLGVLTVTTPTKDASTQMQTLSRAADYFRRAIAENPANVAAEANLELVLRITHAGGSGLGKAARGGFRFAHGHGSSISGSGF